MALDQINTDAIKYLVLANANPHIEDLEGRDACDYAAQRNIRIFPELNNCDR